MLPLSQIWGVLCAESAVKLGSETKKIMSRFRCLIKIKHVFCEDGP